MNLFLSVFELVTYGADDIALEQLAAWQRYLAMNVGFCSISFHASDQMIHIVFKSAKKPRDGYGFRSRRYAVQRWSCGS